MFFAQTHYGGPLNFSDELLNSAKKGCEKISNLLEMTDHQIQNNFQHGINPDFDFQKFHNDFISVLDDDFNTPQGVAVIFDFIRAVNTVISENERINIKFYHKVKLFLKETAYEVLGIIDMEEVKNNSNLSIENELIELLIKIRDELKKEKQFSLADQVRDGLTKIGITLKDTKNGVTFKRN
jgi:cysteinyl-tRNA synthetase